MSRSKLMLCICALLLICSAALASDYVDFSDSQHDYGAYVAIQSQAKPSRGTTKRKTADEGRALVLMKTDGGTIDLDDLNADICAAGPDNRFTLFFPSRKSAIAAVDVLSKDRHVLYAELDSDITACDTAVRDTVEFNSYGASGMGIGSLLSWARRETGSAAVAVIDSGVSPHALFADRLFCGYDYVDGDDDPTNDEYGHGTHVAGIVADCTRGTPVTLCAIRVMDASGNGFASNAANGILEAIELGVPVINLSFAGTTPSAALDDAVLNAVASGCAVVAAAGNGGMDTAGVWPAHLTEAGVIVVGAADADGSRASYSNYGASVDCLAYGTDVISCSTSGGYEMRSGTSQAAPHIAAACALLHIVRGGVSPAALEAQLKSVLNGSGAALPMVDRLVPQRIDAHLSALTMGVGEMLPLPVQAFPVSCGQEITWGSSDTSVISVAADGTLIAENAGVADLTGRCANFNGICARVTVIEDIPGKLVLPSGLIALEAGALANTAAACVVMGPALANIAEDVIDPDVLILCPRDSCAAEYAENNGLQYITVNRID